MKLLKSELKVFGSACDATADLFIALDESFCIQFTNKFAERVLLHNQESLQDRSFIDYLKINQLPLFLDNCIKSKHSESINLNGFFIRWKVYAGTLDGLKSFFLIGENITEQEQLYLAVEEECRKIMGHDFPKRLSIPQYINEVRNYLTSIINKIPCYVYWKGKDLKYRGCNELGAKFLNISSSAEIIGKTDLELFSNKALAESYREDDRKVLASKTGMLNQPGELINEKGELSYTLVSKVPLTNEDNEVLGIVGVSLDITELKETQLNITELKETQKELIIAKEKAESANLAKSTLISNMGHDLKTPFIGIEGNAEILCDYYSENDPDMKELWDHMRASTVEIKKIISEIIETVDMKNPSIKLEKFSINQMLEDIKRLLLATADSKQLDLVINKLDSKKSDMIETDKLRLKLIINHLASNAIKFTNHGKVELTLLKKGEHFHILVADTGIGIPDDQLKNIFEPFTKLSLSNKHNTFQGVGSGLYSAQIKAEELGAVIEVKSCVDKGSTFTFIIPAHPK